MTYIDATTAIATHAAVTQNVHGVGANDIADVADISTHAAVTTNIHGTGAGNAVVGDDELVSVPTGVIFPYGGAAAPSGYLLCDGAAVSRSTYSALFAVIAELYGAGDGTTTFNVPDMGGNVPVGIGGSGVTARGDVGGEQTHTLITSEIPAHTHHTAGDTSGTGNIRHTEPQYSHCVQCPSSSTGGDGAHENMQPYVGTEYIIKT